MYPWMGSGHRHPPLSVYPKIEVSHSSLSDDTGAGKMPKAGYPLTHAVQASSDALGKDRGPHEVKSRLSLPSH